MASQTVLIRIVATFLCVSSTLCLCGCVTYFGYDGPYEGRVIDRDTRQPIEGAVVHGTWYKAHPGPGGASHTYYDSKEVLTDKDGRFSIEGLGLKVFSNMEEMDINILKAGYTQWHGPWEGLRNNHANVEWEGKMAIIQLRHMSLDERKRRGIDFPLSEPDKKQRLLRIESNNEMREIGMPPSTLLPVE